MLSQRALREHEVLSDVAYTRHRRRMPPYYETSSSSSTLARNEQHHPQHGLHRQTTGWQAAVKPRQKLAFLRMRVHIGDP